jgi:type I restriction enzyme, S subunit
MHLNQLRITVPPPAIAALFEEQAEAVYEEIKILLDTNSNLRAARDLLLPRLMSGQVVV